jgi:hypothetical protein
MATIAKQVDFLITGYTHPTTGAPLNGGKVKTYLDGTSTLSSLWTARDKSGVAANPVILDSAGRAEVYGDNTYKFEVYDSADVLLETLNGMSYSVGATGYVVDTFSGDDATVAFTLSSAPVTENATTVYISGVYQQKSTYSVSDTTLTFSEAPPTGTNNIEVVSV